MVSAKSIEKTVFLFVYMINAPMVERIGVILILSMCQCQEHGIDNIFCLFDRNSHHRGLQSSICTVSIRAGKLTVAAYMISSKRNVEEIGLFLIGLNYF